MTDHATQVIEKPSHGHDTARHDEPDPSDHGHTDHGHSDHGHGGHDAHGHGGHGGHDDHGGHGGGHDDHGHHAPPAPKYIVEPPARVGDIAVRTWVAYAIFLLMILLVAGLMLAGFGR